MQKFLPGFFLFLFFLLVLTAGCSPDANYQDLHDCAELVVLADEADPYYPLAQEIAAQENSALATTLEDALSLNPAALVWVASPAQLTPQRLSQAGMALRGGCTPMLGIITGRSLESARQLWQRQLSKWGDDLVLQSRLGHLTIYKDGTSTPQEISPRNYVGALADARLLVVEGHGGPGFLRLDENSSLRQENVPDLLPPLAVIAFSCQTFQPAHPDSIALAFTENGVALYSGFLHSPTGYTFGGSTGLPLRHTWEDFPIGMVVVLQNRSMLQGYLHFPFLFLLGDPRQAFLEDPAYAPISDAMEGDVRVLRFQDLPAGALPIRVGGGARYEYVEAEGITSAWADEPFYNPFMQMTTSGDDLYLLLVHKGGDVTLRLRPSIPFLRALSGSFLAATNQVMVLELGQKDIVWSLATAILIASISIWQALRGKLQSADWLRAAVMGLLAAFLKGLYALLRGDVLLQIDEGFQFSVMALIMAFLSAGSGCLLFTAWHMKRGRTAALLAVSFPACAVTILWIGVVCVANLLGLRQYGAGLYGFGRTAAGLIVTALEIALFLIVYYFPQSVFRGKLFRRKPESLEPNPEPHPATS